MTAAASDTIAPVPEKALIVSARTLGKSYSPPMGPGSIALRALVGLPPKIWHQALQDVSFDIRSGENVGILGRNGAGKSTLLSLVAGAMQPDTGTLDVSGRVAAVLSLGRGLDPQLPGRENAILFARTLGATKAEVLSKMDDIQEFSELGGAFDAPMRTYSSGMRARLAFSTAFHVDADLMILDETLAVGDLSFRFKCYEALAARQKSQDTSLLIVSHNPMTLSRFCERIIVIDAGTVAYDGPAEDGLIAYKELRVRADDGLDDADGPEFAVIEPQGEASRIFRPDESAWFFPLRLRCLRDCGTLSLRVGLADQTGVTLSAMSLDIPAPSVSGWKAGEQAEFDVLIDPVLHASKGRLAATLELVEVGGSRPIYHNPKLMRWRVAGEIREGQRIRLNALRPEGGGLDATTDASALKDNTKDTMS